MTVTGPEGRCDVLEPTGLFTWDDFVDQRTIHADTLVVTLGSFADIGHTQRIVDAHLLNTLPNRVLGHFDVDQLHDYTGRRPTVLFDRDHFEQFRAPEITLSRVTDAAGTDFLLLRGPEPSLQWERMAAAIGHLVEQLGVKKTVLLQSMPSPVPHTRPVSVSRFATASDLLPGNQPFLGTFQVSSSFNALLTVRLGERGHDAIGLLAHVPHYLADTDFPAASVAVLEGLRDAGGGDAPSGHLAAASEAALGAIDDEVAASEELTEMVQALEEQYDAFAEGRNRLERAEADLPSADELAAEAERFLRSLGDAGPEGTEGWPEAPNPRP